MAETPGVDAPPRALRIVHLSNGLVLQDCSRWAPDPAASPNVVIDAANRGSLEPNVGPQLLLPFRAEPHLVTDKRSAYDARDVLGMDAAAALLGVIFLASGPYLVTVTEVKRAGFVPVLGASLPPPSGTTSQPHAVYRLVPVYTASRVRLVKLHPNTALKTDRDVSASMLKMLESGFLFFSYEADLVRSQQKQITGASGSTFWWNKPLASALGPLASTWAVRAIMGYVGSVELPIYRSEAANGQGRIERVYVTVLSRKSRKRAGTRYHSRGIDQTGHVANFVETEQIVFHEHRCTSFVSIRGSIPVFWRQTKGALRPAPELDAPLLLSQAAFTQHFKNLSRSYGRCTAVSLVNTEGSESVVARAYAQQVDLASTRGTAGPATWAPRFVEFDFHRHCHGKEYERGICALLSRLLNDLDAYGFMVDARQLQTGVFRVNCIDCLDRTGVVQSALAKQALQQQLAVILNDASNTGVASGPATPDASPSVRSISTQRPIQLSPDGEATFMRLWSNNADALSYQYAGTAAMKADMARSGRRSTKGLLQDGLKSAVRIFNKHFIDDDRQEAYDLMLGYATVARGTEAWNMPSSPDTGAAEASEAVWTSFDQLQWLTGSGERIHVVVLLRDTELLVRTPEHIEYAYARERLVQYERLEQSRGKYRLRLRFHGDRQPVPLDLVFHHPAMREVFLRAVLTWSGNFGLMLPASLLPHAPSGAFRIQIRVASASRPTWPATAADWGLPRATEHPPALVALVLPDSGTSGRRFGLAALPNDLDTDGLYRCVAARALPRGGAALALLVRIDAADAVAEVFESSVAAENSLSGLVAIGLRIYGTGICFLGGRLRGRSELLPALQSLQLGRSDRDTLLQWDYWYASGALGDLSGLAMLSASARAAHIASASSEYTVIDERAVLSWATPDRKRLHEGVGLSAAGRLEANDIAVVVDEYVFAARTGPQIPLRPVRVSLVLDSLHSVLHQLPNASVSGQPLNADTPLQYYLSFSSDVLADVFSTSLSGPVLDRAPRWNGRFALPYLPSDLEEIREQLVHGHLMIMSPVGDDQVCGSMVLSVGGLDGRQPFQVPLFRGGQLVGRLAGFAQLQLIPEAAWVPFSSSMSETTRAALAAADMTATRANGAGLGVTSAESLDSSSLLSTTSGGGAKRSQKRRVKRLVGTLTDWVRGERRESTAKFGGPRFTITNAGSTTMASQSTQGDAVPPSGAPMWTTNALPAQGGPQRPYGGSSTNVHASSQETTAGTGITQTLPIENAIPVAVPLEDLLQQVSLEQPRSSSRMGANERAAGDIPEESWAGTDAADWSNPDPSTETTESWARFDELPETETFDGAEDESERVRSATSRPEQDLIEL
ncbi:hypothetical protein CCYA_CCYA11G3009 [Cyanidiococcus yangmingshanensis]|nr:hypothetical protein CCYA_CCYA11G3009 [Cyanidiococcus yangmingshanensis]